MGILITAMSISLQDISIRTVLKPGDIGHVVLLHGLLYNREYGYGLGFESYVAGSLSEFYKNYDKEKDCVWVCEYKQEMIGFLLLMHRENNSAQLRYFIIVPAFRGIGLGNKLMQLFTNFLKQKKYTSCYLWTTSELYTAASLYKRFGFVWTLERPSASFGKSLTEQRYDLKEIK